MHTHTRTLGQIALGFVNLGYHNITSDAQDRAFAELADGLIGADIYGEPEEAGRALAKKATAILLGDDCQWSLDGNEWLDDLHYIRPYYRGKRNDQDHLHIDYTGSAWRLAVEVTVDREDGEDTTVDLCVEARKLGEAFVKLQKAAEQAQSEWEAQSESDRAAAAGDARMEGWKNGD